MPPKMKRKAARRARHSVYVIELDGAVLNHARFRKANPDRLATALLAAVEGGIMLAQVRRDPAPLETALDEVLDRIEDLRPRRAQARQ